MPFSEKLCHESGSDGETDTTVSSVGSVRASNSLSDPPPRSQPDPPRLSGDGRRYESEKISVE